MALCLRAGLAGAAQGKLNAVAFARCARSSACSLPPWPCCFRLRAARRQSPGQRIWPVNSVSEGEDAPDAPGLRRRELFHRPVPAMGLASIKSVYKGVTFRFATPEHKAIFERAPEKYVPQFGGYCTNGIVYGIPWERDRQLVDHRRQALHVRRQGSLDGSTSIWRATWRSRRNTGPRRSKAPTLPSSAPSAWSSACPTTRRVRELAAEVAATSPSSASWAFRRSRSPPSRVPTVSHGGSARAVVRAGDERRGEAPLPLEAHAGIRQLLVGRAFAVGEHLEERAARDRIAAAPAPSPAARAHLGPRLVEQVVGQPVDAGLDRARLAFAAAEVPEARAVAEDAG